MKWGGVKKKTTITLFPKSLSNTERTELSRKPSRTKYALFCCRKTSRNLCIQKAGRGVGKYDMMTTAAGGGGWVPERSEKDQTCKLNFLRYRKWVKALFYSTLLVTPRKWWWHLWTASLLEIHSYNNLYSQLAVVHLRQESSRPPNHAASTFDDCIKKCDLFILIWFYYGLVNRQERLWLNRSFYSFLVLYIHYLLQHYINV